MAFKIIRNDITRMKTDAIVNAANIKLEKDGGVCRAIFEAACKNIGGCSVEEAVHSVLLF